MSDDKLQPAQHIDGRLANRISLEEEALTRCAYVGVNQTVSDYTITVVKKADCCGREQDGPSCKY